MPSSSSNPTFDLYWVPAAPPHPDHPALTMPDLPFTLTQVTPGNYQMTFTNSLERSARIFCLAFTQQTNPLWSRADVVLATRSLYKVLLPKSVLNGATTIWLGAWWDDGTYQNAAAYFAAHPSGDGHHTVPITVG